MSHIHRDVYKGPSATDAAAGDDCGEDLEGFLDHLRGDILAGAPDEVAWPILLRARIDGLPTAPARPTG